MYDCNGECSFRATGQHENADELLERSLYALEMAWHPWFNPITNPDCRLKYEEECNRPFFHALFKHMLVRCVSDPQPV